MQVIKEWQLKQLREEYPVGTRAELIHTIERYRSMLPRIYDGIGHIKLTDDPL